MDGSPSAMLADGTAPTQGAAARAEARVDSLLAAGRRTVLHVVDMGRFLLFLVYAVFGVLAFWLWVLSVFLLALRGLLGIVMIPLLWMADGTPRNAHGVPVGVVDAAIDRSRRRWTDHASFRASVVRPLAVHIHDARRAGIRFLYLSVARKALVLVFAFFFILLPLVYIIPRPNYVQVVDDNSIHHTDGGTRVKYLIHAVDLFKIGVTHEYENEQALYLLKINPQGFKNRIEPGRYYKFWVVGIRWNLPQVFPNIVGMTEIDRHGQPLKVPSHFVPETTTGR
jgi:hypothetical protein